MEAHEVTEYSVRERFAKAKQAAAGRWRDIFVSAGIEEKRLIKPNQPCPMCGGRDRFSFTDKFKGGDYLCRHCGHGDGFELLSRFLSVSIFDALELVERFCGLPVPSRRERREEKCSDTTESFGRHETPYHLQLWREAHPVMRGDAVWRYLENRGLHQQKPPVDIRTHEALLYWDEDVGQARFPAMLARMTDADGIVTAVHRTYLTEDGVKAPVAVPKKITATSSIRGAVVQLGEPDAVLGIAEGIETALAAAEWFEMAVWAAIGAENLANFSAVPAGVRRVVIFADNDANFVGQEAAYRLAKRLVSSGFQVEVALPDEVGHDWLDEYVALQNRRENQFSALV